VLEVVAVAIVVAVDHCCRKAASMAVEVEEMT
jgi:hypothetical protein